ncbi:MAG: TrkA C-terminal domain-containing protein [Candidatus Aminicenantaceae bacterium]
MRWLMIMGNAGVVTVIVTATSSMSTSQGYLLPLNILILIVGILLIYKLAKYRGFTRKWEHFIEKKLIKSPAFEESATEDLLHFLEGYGLVKKIVLEESPLHGKSLVESKLNEKGILVLGIERDKKWIPTPKAAEIIKSGDNLVIYGPLEVLKSKLED